MDGEAVLDIAGEGCVGCCERKGVSATAFEKDMVQNVPGAKTGDWLAVR